ncbi:MAG TPA: trypsin-like peptidase domain-containing protein [Actinomycetota bacterium]|nr:trypsin-like peptidase domain-containing protein [Actinomycetota bacterium]
MSINAGGPSRGSLSRRRWFPYAAGGAVGLVVAAAVAIGVGVFGATATRPATGHTGVAVGIPAQNVTVTAVPGAAGAPSPPPGAAPKFDIRAALRAVEPGVVDITDYASSSPGTERETGAGTGMILDTQGDVLTNAHVVAGGTSFSVQPSGETTVYQAKVSAVDTTDDVAVIKIINPGKLTPVPLGDSNALQVGDPVITIGNALNLEPGGPTVSQGIISALGRSLVTDNGNNGTESLTGLIQTDAPINPGNSGGPLIDAAGQVIGMNTAVSTDGQNIGFVIPINRITPLLNDLKSGTVPPSTQGFLGVQLQANASATGAQIASVVPGSPAATSGLQVGDLITAVDGQQVSSDDDAVADIGQYQAGTQIGITYTRAGASQTAIVTLGSKPASPSP